MKTTKCMELKVQKKLFFHLPKQDKEFYFFELLKVDNLNEITLSKFEVEIVYLPESKPIVKV